MPAPLPDSHSSQPDSARAVGWAGSWESTVCVDAEGCDDLALVGQDGRLVELLVDEPLPAQLRAAGGHLARRAGAR